MSGNGAVHAQVRRQTQFSGDRPLKLTTYRDSEIDEKTIQLLKVIQLSCTVRQLAKEAVNLACLSY